MILTPAILDLPHSGFAVGVKTNALKHHGVSHERLAVVQALGLVECTHNGEAKQAVDVERGGIHDALIAQIRLVNVATKPDGQVVLELCNSHALELSRLKVKVAYLAILVDVAQARHGKDLVKGLIGRRRRDQRDVIVQIHLDGLLEKFLWRKVARKDQLVVLIAQANLKVRGGLAQGDDKQTINLAHHFFFHAQKIVVGSTSGLRLAQALCSPAQITGQISVQVVGARRVCRLGHGLFGAHTVLFDEALKHVPLSAIAHGVGQQIAHQTTIQRLVGGVDDILQEPVAFLELIEEQRVGLRKLKGLQVEVLHDANAEGVERRKHPATTTSLLVGAFTLLDLDVKDHGVIGDGFGNASHSAHAL